MRVGRGGRGSVLQTRAAPVALAAGGLRGDVVDCIDHKVDLGEQPVRETGIVEQQDRLDLALGLIMRSRSASTDALSLPMVPRMAWTWRFEFVMHEIEVVERGHRVRFGGASAQWEPHRRSGSFSWLPSRRSMALSPTSRPMRSKRRWRRW